MSPLLQSRALVAGLSAASGPAFPILTCDSGRIERALAETRVDRVPAGPSLVSYMEALSEAIARWIARMFSLHGDVWSDFTRVLEILALVLVAVAIALVSLAIWRRFRRGRLEKVADPEDLRMRTAGETAARTAAEWREELERRFSSGDLAGALEALWWWVARAIGGSSVDDSWTSRQLLMTFRWEDLAADVGRLDRMIYGAQRPAAEDIRRLLSRLTEALG